MSLFKSVATISGFTAISRIVGFIRDVLIARFLGASMMADAFFVALRFPNLFRSLFAEGNLNVAFVPLFSGELQENGRRRALEFAAAAFSFLFYVLLIFTVVMELMMPSLMFLLAPGFGSIEGKLELTTRLSRITFPFLMCISLVSLMAGMLNAVGKFWAAAFVSTFLSLAMIAGLLFLTPLIASEFASAYAVAWGVLAAGFIELIFLWWHLKRARLLFRLLPPMKALFRLSAGVKTLLRKMAPGVLGSGAYQINLFLDTLFVSFVGAGAISWLNYAHRFFQLPVGIIGVAIGTVLLPVLSRHIRSRRMRQAHYHFNRGLELALALSVAAMIGLVFLAQPIVGILFERGAFTAADTAHTARALIVFALGLPAYVMTKALSPFFYARGDTTTPVKIALFGIVVNAILAVSLMQIWGYAGIALATSLTVWINVGQYIFRLAKLGDLKPDSLFRFRLPRILLACASLAGTIWLGIKGMAVLFPTWQEQHFIIAAAGLGAIITAGTAVFLGVLILSGGIPSAQLKAFVKPAKKA